MSLTNDAPARPETPQRREMTIAEKILAGACGLAQVAPGDFIRPDPELVIIHDGYVESAHRQLDAIGYKRITHPERVMFVTDHDVIYTSLRVAERARNNRRIAAAWRVGRFFDAGQGGHGHIFPMEKGLVRPGMFLFAYDMHCTNFGSLGALAWGAGPEIVSVLATGSLLIEVPRTLRVVLTGSMRDGVHPRDLGFLLAGDLASGRGGRRFDNRIVEFAGEAVERMTVAERVALCNTLTEIGVANTIFPPMSFDGRPVPELDHLRSDPGAEYEDEVAIDLGDLTPQLALPGAPENAAPIAAAVGRPIDHAYIGSCGSSMFEDFEAALKAMDGRPIAAGVRMVIVPGSVEISRRMAASGMIDRFTSAGAIVMPSSCGPCAGGRSGLLAPGEVSISTAATNTAGRMGAPTSEAYLASPVTVAASAVAGRIVDPREAKVQERLVDA
jgi:3-isopropylmalate/(R)-2-methylmalate dehydratase large subunit